MYGLYDGFKQKDVELEECLEVHAAITDVKTLNEYEAIGYGASYIVDKEAIIATCAIGYADGILRVNQGRMVELEDGTEAQIVGRVCMDQLMIKLPKHYEVGTIVKIIGGTHNVKYTADYTDTITYEVVCNLSKRLPRVYKK
jgi:alanine racemase